MFAAMVGLPKMQRRNGDRELEYHYRGLTARFDAETEEFRECTLGYGSPVRLNDKDVDWSAEGFRELCAEDGHPQECHGTVLLLRLGVALTGLADDAADDRSLTAFRWGDWDDFAEQMKAINIC
jgi:hypothetical protein